MLDVEHILGSRTIWLGCNCRSYRKC